MKKFFYALIYMIFILVSAETRTVKNEQKFSGAAGKSYLIIIAIDKYQNRLPLNRCVKEAQDFKNTVFADYKFDEMIELYDRNATYDNFMETFKNIQKLSGDNDSVLIYFNGHGFMDPSTGEGYWILHDSGINEQLKERWLPNREFVNIIGRIRSRHLALICESCFSEKLVTEEGKKIPKEDEEYFRNAFEKKSALAFLSGKSETGAEESEMTREIVKTLKLSKKTWTDLLILYNDIKSRVKGSRVILGSFNSIFHEADSGHVLFLRDDPIDMKEYEAKKTEPAEVKDKTREKEKPKEKEIIVKKEKTLTFQPAPDLLKTLNITSLSLLISGSAVASLGTGLFIYDMVVIFGDLNRLLNEEYYSGNYTRYDQLYTLNLAFFCTGLSVAGTGLLLMAAALPLRIYVVMKKKQAALNINFRDKIEIAASIKF